MPGTPFRVKISLNYSTEKTLRLPRISGIHLRKISPNFLSLLEWMNLGDTKEMSQSEFPAGNLQSLRNLELIWKEIVSWPGFRKVRGG